MSPLNSTPAAPSVHTHGELHGRLAEEVPRLAHYAKGRFGSERGLEVVQEALLSALQRADTYDGARPVWPWLKVIADRCAARSRQQQSRAPAALSDPDALPCTAGPGAEGEELAHLLERLEPGDAQLLRRHHLQGQSVAEIAATTGAPQGTIKARLWRARRKLAALAGAGLAVIVFVQLRRSAPEVAPASPEKPAVRGRLLSSSLTVTITHADPPELRFIDLSPKPVAGWHVTSTDPNSDSK